MNGKRVSAAVFVLVLIIASAAFATGQVEEPAADEPEVTGVLTMFHAGSLSVPFETMEREFEEMYPGVDLQREAAGSTASARKISELAKPADIMASADYTVIDKILIPDWATVNIRFATNQLVLCYTDSSRFADEVNADNWYDILTRPGVVWGHSDPNLDPCGYRSLMVMQLAERHYGQRGLYQDLLANRPEENVRPKSVDLISLLQTGNMDYAWEYLSVAEQHGLNYVTIPDAINLGNYEFDDEYATAVVEVTGSEPGAMIEMRGGSITYGITLVHDAPNPVAAQAFLEYMLDPEHGLRILREMGQPPFIPARVPTATMYDALPESLQELVEVRN